MWSIAKKLSSLLSLNDVILVECPIAVIISLFAPTNPNSSNIAMRIDFSGYVPILPSLLTHFLNTGGMR